MLDCESLHDLKGHLWHLLAELPHVLPQPTKALCSELLENVMYSRREGGLTGADLWVALLELYKLLKAQDVGSDIKLLLETGVLYAGEERRTPNTILQLYNCTWVHHELCLSLFPSPKENSTKEFVFFGTYLRALVVHSPPQ